LRQSSNQSQKVEEARTICLRGEHILWGSHADGQSSTRVKLSIRCPSGSSPIGVFHTHPGSAEPIPSPQDIAEMKRAGLEHLCIKSPEKNLLKCFRIK